MQSILDTDTVKAVKAVKAGTMPTETDHPGRSRSRFTRSQILTLIAGCCSTMFINIANASIPLILPPTIVAKGIPYAYSGLIFGLFSISNVIFEPFQAKIIPFLGTRTTFCVSSFTGGACYLALAVLNITEMVAAFVAPATIIRFVEGFAYATLSTSSNVIVCLAFSEHATIAFGILECFVGIGYTLGPVLSGALYAAGGFSAACIFIGLSLLMTGLLGYFFLQQITGVNLRPKPRETKHVLTDRIFLGVGFVNFATGMNWGIFGTSLEPYLASFDQGAQVEGLIFAIAFLAYAGTAPIFGWAFRRFHVDYRWIVLVPLGVAVIWMLLGPIPAFSFIPPRLLWLDTVLLFVMNVFIAFGCVLVFDISLKRALTCGLEENVATYALILATFFTTIYIGDAIGAVIGSSVYFQYGFIKIAQIAAGLMFAFTAISALMLLINWNRSRGLAHRMFPSWIKPEKDTEVVAYETSPLTSSGEPVRDRSSERPSYYRQITTSLSVGTLGQTKNDYGTINTCSTTCFMSKLNHGVRNDPRVFGWFENERHRPLTNSNVPILADV
ncbi:hypothetical protein RvY_19049 [Ramazzottius varieornatus]|uniref:Major facilitator superfamily (MFS) profile domain-containing protein n=1 Tax=Ramazzottius varieornatus TaxID=947166 RepID=A0A1D1W818_RAMVA|nr:hypothetical protein RvY_19049 [Ramazzottius varieornatus]